MESNNPLLRPKPFMESNKSRNPLLRPDPLWSPVTLYRGRKPFMESSNLIMEAKNPFEYCLFCDKPESNYDPGPNIDFICGDISLK